MPTGKIFFTDQPFWWRGGQPSSTPKPAHSVRKVVEDSTATNTDHSAKDKDHVKVSEEASQHLATENTPEVPTSPSSTKKKPSSPARNESVSPVITSNERPSSSSTPQIQRRKVQFQILDPEAGQRQSLIQHLNLALGALNTHL